MKEKTRTRLPIGDKGNFRYGFNLDPNTGVLTVCKIPENGRPGDWYDVDYLFHDIERYLDAGFTEFRNREYDKCGKAITDYVRNVWEKNRKARFAEDVADKLSHDDIMKVTPDEVAEVVHLKASKRKAALLRTTRIAI